MSMFVYNNVQVENPWITQLTYIFIIYCIEIISKHLIYLKCMFYATISQISTVFSLMLGQRLILENDSLSLPKTRN